MGVLIILRQVLLGYKFQISFLWAFDPVPQVEARLHELFPDYDFTNQTVSGTLSIIQFSALYTIVHMVTEIAVFMKFTAKSLGSTHLSRLRRHLYSPKKNHQEVVG